MSAEAEAIVEDFLAAMGRGDLESAAAHLAPGAVMIFPGDRRYTRLRDLADASATRYRRVDKHRTEYESFTAPGGEVVVWSMGTLFGENNHGVRYDGVRYVDRFRLVGGRIVEQRVWNDLEISGVLTARGAEEVDARWRPAPSAVVRRVATAAWGGALRGGAGVLTVASGATGPLPISLETRKTSAAPATSPEELLAAAHAACFAMALRGALDAVAPGTPEQAVEVTGTCVLRIDASGWTIDAVRLDVTTRGVPRAALDAALPVAGRRCAISNVIKGNAEVTVTVREQADE
ncbi:OsmC family protein [Herbidospora yilanensis]|uniref:OsmC family protein n=1 Tax=Herbidospora yilanensis TaxID=354426 RepID=UPI000780B8BB|nr:OsmC family protein [Herbidospora yilanensis]